MEITINENTIYGEYNYFRYKVSFESFFQSIFNILQNSLITFSTGLYNSFRSCFLKES